MQKEAEPTELTEVDPGSILLDARDLVAPLIGHASFTEAFYYLLSGRSPNSDQTAVFDATLSILASHGQLGSHETSVRMTAIPSDYSIQVQIAAGLLGVSKKILGAMQETGQLLERLDGEVLGGRTVSEVANEIVREYRAARTPVPGFGHTTFVGGDPRVPLLVRIAGDHNLAGKYVDYVREIEKALERVLGRHLPLNVTGAVAALLLEIGLPWQVFRGVALISRASALVVHASGERDNPMIPSHLSVPMKST
jgi:citrate synthase